MTPLPMTVISGYLGAGKTTLINRMLADPQGLRLMVMVNDFGAINIDAALIKAQSDDVIALTNGCVCCTMGADFYMALGQALDQRPRADHLIIEASGIADPQAIANTALAEPDLRYGGIVTLVDALNIATLLQDPLIAPQVRQQIAAADLVLQTKSASRNPEVDAVFAAQGLPPADIMPENAITALMLHTDLTPQDTPTVAHPAYVTWHHSSPEVVAHAQVQAAMEALPEGVFRLKGFVRTTQGAVEVHVVGSHRELLPTDAQHETRLVALGLKDRMSTRAVAQWWVQFCAPLYSG